MGVYGFSIDQLMEMAGDTFCFYLLARLQLCMCHREGILPK